MAHVQIELAPPTGFSEPCHLWTGAIDRQGRGKFWLFGNAVLAHRAAVLIHGVDLKPSEIVIQLCCNRACVNPDHLVVGSRSASAAIHFRGRNPVGPGELFLMREMVTSGEATPEFMATQYGLSVDLVNQIAAKGGAINCRSA